MLYCLYCKIRSIKITDYSFESSKMRNLVTSLYCMCSISRIRGWFFREYAAGYFGPNTVLASVRFANVKGQWPLELWKNKITNSRGRCLADWGSMIERKWHKQNPGKYASDFDCNFHFSLWVFLSPRIILEGEKSWWVWDTVEMESV